MVGIFLASVAGPGCSDVSMPLHRRNSSGQAVEDTQYLEEITEAAEPEDTDRLHEITCSAPKVSNDIKLSQGADHHHKVNQ